MRSTQLGGLLSAMLSLLLAVPALAADKAKLAVLDLEAKGVEPSAAANLTDALAVALKRLEVFEILSRADIQQMLNFEGSKQMLGCSSDSACIAEIGGALGVARVVAGSVGKLGDGFVLNLTLLDTKTARVLERESRTATSLQGLAGVVDSAARQLVRGLLAGKQGELVVRCAESGAEVELDGKLIAITPVPRLKLASGPHQVRVSKKGFVTAAQDLIVTANQALPLDVVLVPSPDFIAGYDRAATAMRWGAIGGMGAGAAMLATGLVLYYGVAEPRNTRHNQRYADIVAGQRTSAGDKVYNDEAAAIGGLYRAGQAVGITGAVLAAAGVVLFFVAPKPGIYNHHKTLEVGAAVLPGGAFASGLLRF